MLSRKLWKIIGVPSQQKYEGARVTTQRPLVVNAAAAN
jgi:hypothetical protein